MRDITSSRHEKLQDRIKFCITYFLCPRILKGDLDLHEQSMIHVPDKFPTPVRRFFKSVALSCHALHFRPDNTSPHPTPSSRERHVSLRTCARIFAGTHNILTRCHLNFLPSFSPDTNSTLSNGSRPTFINPRLLQ